MKYIYVPKLKNIIFFSILIVVCASLNLPFFLMQKSIVEYNFDTLLMLHIALPIVYGTIFCMLFSYFFLTLETVISNFKNSLQLKLLNLLSTLEICIGSFVLFLSLPLCNVQIQGLSKMIYFKSLVTNEDITDVYRYWVYILSFSLISCSVIMFFAAARQMRIKKAINFRNKENQKKTEINQFLGFDYENCDFYQQVNIPYLSLQQTDGTRGEFEVYHMLRKSGLTNVKYVFNREIPKGDGLNTELDLIVIHEKGIFVVENKHYTTRVYGNALDHDLTIIDHRGNKRSIYNPIKQNENHVIALKEHLKTSGLYIDDEITPIYSIVVFTAEGDDKTDDIISGISTIGTETSVCTSQNVYHIINQLIVSSNPLANINVLKINEVLLKLPIRKKYS